MSNPNQSKINEAILKGRELLIKNVAKYVTRVKKEVIPDLWLSCGVGDGVIIIDGVEHKYSSDTSDSVLMLLTFHDKIPEYEKRYYEESKQLLAMMEASNKKSHLPKQAGGGLTF